MNKPPVNRTLRSMLLAALLIVPGLHTAPARAAIPEDGHSAVVLAYHRVGEDEYPDSNISLAQFLSHVDEIQRGGYNVISLPQLVENIRSNAEMPPRTIAITFEGAFRSALQNAMPVLLERKIPFTVFYSSDYAGGSSNSYADWDELKALSLRDGVTLGVLPASYARFDAAAPDEIRRQINKARAQHRERFGQEAAYFSYPFGEYSPAYKKIVSDAGFKAAFGLHSGSVFGASDFFALPRFTMTEKYGDTERFRTVAQALPFPVRDVEPQGTMLASEMPSIGFSVPDYLKSSLKSMSCFVTGQSEPEIEILDERVELRLREPIEEERIRVNCTIPGPSDPAEEAPAWRWFGILLAQSGTAERSNQPPTGLP